MRRFHNLVLVARPKVAIVSVEVAPVLLLMLTVAGSKVQ
jgi:hypothetical protein